MKPCIGALILVIGIAGSVSAQDRPQGSAELIVGRATFLDVRDVYYSVVGAALKWHPSPRVAIGPELVYMTRPGHVHDLMLTGNVTVDMLNRRVTPFLVAGGGLFHQTVRFASGDYSSSEGAFTAGGGARIAVTDHFYIAPEARLGWELHTRLSVAVGSRF